MITCIDLCVCERERANECVCMSSFITFVLYTIVYVSLKWCNTSAPHSELPSVKVKWHDLYTFWRNWLNQKVFNIQNITSFTFKFSHIQTSIQTPSFTHTHWSGLVLVMIYITLPNTQYWCPFLPPGGYWWETSEREERQTIMEGEISRSESYEEISRSYFTTKSRN